jgi:DNA-directed RNA polymerase specialized sigma subunit
MKRRCRQDYKLEKKKSKKKDLLTGQGEKISVELSESERLVYSLKFFQKVERKYAREINITNKIH